MMMMRAMLLGLTLFSTALIAGCTVDGSYNSDPVNVTGYPCKVQLSGKALKVNSMDIECTGADPGGNLGLPGVPSVPVVNPR